MEVRLATTEDKCKVLMLNTNVYDGRDYLSAYYDIFLKCPVAIPCVITLDGEIIGYQCGYVIDDGETLVFRAARITPKFQGKGYYKILSRHVTEQARKRYNLQRISQMVRSDNLRVQTESFKKANTLIAKRAITMYRMLTAEVSRWPELLTSVTDIKLSIQGVKAYLDTEVIRKYLFPEDRMIVNSVPYRLRASNLDLVDAENIVCASNVNVIDGIASGLLSIGTFFKACRPKYVYKLDLYGTDVNSVHNHLLFHVGFIAKTLDDLVTLMIFADKRYGKEKLLDTLAEYGIIQKLESDDQETTFQFLYESPL